MTVRGLPGITSRAASVLDAAIEYVHGLESRTVSQFGREIGGLFIQAPESWSLERGWSCVSEFSPFPRKDKTGGQGEGNIGTLTITPGDVSEKAELLMELRSMIANTVIAREGWDPVKTGWRDVVRARVEVMWERNMLTTEHFLDLEDAVLRTQETVESHMLSAFAQPGGPGVEPVNPVLPHIGAYDYLMMSGPQILVGMLHTHPRGNSEPSPEDMISAQTFVHYQKVIRYNPEHLAAAGYTGEVESGAPTQHWILALNTGGWVASLTKFVAGRRMAVITGNFLE